MRCQWCHNPESFRVEPQLGHMDARCSQCGKCSLVCKNHQFVEEKHFIDTKECTACGNCVRVCPNDALQVFGRYMEAGQVIAEVLKDVKFYHSSGGGVTFSGGEPTMQPKFLMALLTLSKENGLHVCLETNGLIQPDFLLELIPFVDIWLFDYKATGNENHKKYTGARCDQVLQNLHTLHKNYCQVMLRCPIIIGVNDNQEHFNAIQTLWEAYENIIQVECMPYHNLGTGKWSQIGEISSLLPLMPTDSQKQEWERIINRKRTFNKPLDA